MELVTLYLINDTCPHVWTAQDVRTYKPHEMETRHLLNCIRLLERRNPSLVDVAYEPYFYRILYHIKNPSFANRNRMPDEPPISQPEFVAFKRIYQKIPLYVYMRAEALKRGVILYKEGYIAWSC